MKLILKRIAKRKNYTIGKLYLSPLGESESGKKGERKKGDGLIEKKGGRKKEEINLHPSSINLHPRLYICDTLEPPCIEMKVDRTVEEVLNDKALLRSIKPCAIPEGEYRVSMTYSPRYKTQLPLITGDSLFNSLWQGIRIHAGNTAKDTQGCILVGENKIVGMVINSRLTLRTLLTFLKGRDVKLSVKS